MSDLMHIVHNYSSRCNTTIAILQKSKVQTTTDIIYYGRQTTIVKSLYCCQ